MEMKEFRIDGPILKDGIPIPIAINALSNFQSIVDKSYLVLFDKGKMSATERNKFYLKASEFRKGSFLTYFEIALHGVQLGLPLVSSLGPQNIWDLTKDSFSFLKTVCAATKTGDQPTYNFENNEKVEVKIGDEKHIYNAPVIQIAKLSLPNYQELSHMLGTKKLTEISAGSINDDNFDIFLSEVDREIFDIPTKISQETTSIRGEVFDFNKYKNMGKISVKDSGQGVPPGEYNFSVLGEQDNVEYIYSLLKPVVVLNCLIEEQPSPFGGKSIHKLHITGVNS